jgi:hypothetical protein
VRRGGGRCAAAGCASLCCATRVLCAPTRNARRRARHARARRRARLACGAHTPPARLADRRWLPRAHARRALWLTPPPPRA